LSPRDIDGGIPISVIGMAAGLTDKGGVTLAIGLITVSTFATRSRRIARVYRVQWYAGKSGLVGKERTELTERPGGMAIALRTSNRAIGTFPNVPEFFNRYCLPVGLGLTHNAFRYDMIGVALKPGLFAREFLKMAFRAPGSTLLKTLPKRIMPFPVFLDNFPAEDFTFRVSSQVNDTQINAKGITCLMRGRGRYFEGDSQVEDALTVDQIGLPLDLVKSRLLILSNTEGNEHTSREGQKGNSVQPLERHHTGVIDNSPLRLEEGLDALIALIGFTSFADSPNSQLSRKFIRRTQLTIDDLLQFKLIGRLLAESNFSHIVGGCIKRRILGEKQRSHF
jgi:hypothetical protein